MNEFKLLMILILPLIGTLMSFYMGTYSEKRREFNKYPYNRSQSYIDNSPISRSFTSSTESSY